MDHRIDLRGRVTLAADEEVRDSDVQSLPLPQLLPFRAVQGDVEVVAVQRNGDIGAGDPERIGSNGFAAGKDGGGRIAIQIQRVVRRHIVRCHADGVFADNERIGHGARLVIGAGDRDGERLAAGIAAAVIDLRIVGDDKAVAGLEPVEIGCGRVVGPMERIGAAAGRDRIETDGACRDQRGDIEAAGYGKAVQQGAAVAGHRAGQRVAHVGIRYGHRSADRADGLQVRIRGFRHRRRIGFAGNRRRIVRRIHRDGEGVLILGAAIAHDE